MKTYLQKCSEATLYLSIGHGAWCSETDRFSGWRIGDRLIIVVDRGLAALLEVTSEPYVDNTPFWRDKIYPHRVSIELIKIIHPQNRYMISHSDTADILIKHHGSNYLFSIDRDAIPLNAEAAYVLHNRIVNSPEWHTFDIDEAIDGLAEAQFSREKEIFGQSVQLHSDDPEHGAHHIEVQYLLGKLGRAFQFDVWIPKADRPHAFRDEELGKLSLETLPESLEDGPAQVISRYIDVIWFQDGQPAYFFEVDDTDNIFNSILKFSDLLTLMPSIEATLYICASAENKSKLFNILSRPTFTKDPVALDRRCRFIPADALQTFMNTQRDMLRHFNITVLEEISEPFK
ncbi:MAG: hypothetical protein L0154_17385 [Chloroflexi bacterium]|nr:hypothetical protein [Chloroflexota bacterium]